jgi:hypothetical protein
MTLRVTVMELARSAGQFAYFATALFLGPTAAWPQPSVHIVQVEGSPQVRVKDTTSACTTGGLGSGTRQAILDAAAREWAAFEFPRLSLTGQNNYRVIPDGISPRIADTMGSGPAPRLLTVGQMEDDTAVRERIGRYWAAIKSDYEAVFEQQNALWKRSGGRAGWAEYWSAAFVSYVMCLAGFPDEAFARASAHRDYIMAAVEARAGERPGYAYHAFDLAEAAPKAGDIICAAREDKDRTINSIADFKAKSAHGAYHCDVVVGFDKTSGTPGVAYAIGGNVLNSVTLTETPLRNGRVTPVKTPHARNWFGLLRYVGPNGPASFQKVPDEVRAKAKAVRDARSAVP